MEQKFEIDDVSGRDDAMGSLDECCICQEIVTDLLDHINRSHKDFLDLNEDAGLGISLEQSGVSLPGLDVTHSGLDDESLPGLDLKQLGLDDESVPGLGISLMQSGQDDESLPGLGISLTEKSGLSLPGLDLTQSGLDDESVPAKKPKIEKIKIKKSRIMKQTKLRNFQERKFFKKKVKRQFLSSCTIRGCGIIIKGIACKLCTFKSTGKDLMKNHIGAKHNNSATENVLEKCDSKSKPMPLRYKQNYKNSTEKFNMSAESQLTIKPESSSHIYAAVKPMCNNTVASSSESKLIPIQEILANTENQSKFRDKSHDSINSFSVIASNQEPVLETPIKLIQDSSINKDTITKDEQVNEMDEQSGNIESKFIPKVEMNDRHSFVNCRFCKKEFESVVQLNAHINKSHILKKSMTADTSAVVSQVSKIVDAQSYCFLCSRQYKTKNSLYDHNMSEHAQKNLTCDTCGKKFARRTHLNKHNRDKHLLVNLKCKFCSKLFSTIKTLKVHLIFVHDYRMESKEQVLFGSKDSNKFTSIAADSEMTTQFNFKLNENEVSVTPQNPSQPNPFDQVSGIPCTECKRVFRNKTKLYAHRIITHEERTIMCHNCGDRFARQNQLHRHIRFSHNMKMNVPCPHCNLVLLNERSLYLHIRMFHKEKRFKCQFCSQYFAKKELLKDHKISLHPECITFKCLTCSIEFPTQNVLTRHETKEHNIKPYVSTTCNAEYTQNQTLQKHSTRVHPRQKYTNGKVFSCKECSNVLHTSSHLKRHMINKHSNSTDNKCNICITVFETRNKLKRHNILVHPKPEFQCEHCNKEFLNKGHLIRHTNNSKSNLDKLKCELCCNIFKCYNQIKTHRTEVHPDVRHACLDCKKEFSSKWRLSRHHRQVHSVEKDLGHHNSTSEVQLGGTDWVKDTFKDEDSKISNKHTKSKDSNAGKIACEQCEKYFSSKWHLKRHTDLKHSGVERFDCMQCSQKFISKSLLKIHTSDDHGGVKFDCKQCDANFSQKCHFERHLENKHVMAQIKAHNIKVHPDVRHVCLDCKKEFSSKWRLNRHHRQVHSVDKDLSHHSSTSEVQLKGTDWVKDTFKDDDSKIPNKHTNSNDSNGGKIACEQCEKYFSSKWHLKRHINLKHSAVERFDCMQCSHKFISKSLLKIHTDDHGEARFVCNQCGTNFSQKCHFEKHLENKHIMAHFQCSSCPKSYKTELKLESHICFSEFPSTSDLKCHTEQSHPRIQIKMEFTKKESKDKTIKLEDLSVSQPNVFPCTICNIDFVTLKIFELHTKAVHDPQILREPKKY